jgi:hypothetical protein
MIGWAIQHVPSGGFLPQPRGRGGRGGTHVEPTQIEFPRIFTTQGAAKCALTNWLAGKVTVSVYEYDGEYDENWHYEPVADRRAEDMRVVALKVEVVE